MAMSDKSLNHIRRAKRAQAGMTLGELMVSMLIAAVLGYVALPNFSELSGTFNRLNARSYVMIDLKRAQSESITQGCRGIVKIASDGKSYTFGCDYLDYDTATNPSPDRTSFRRFLPERITITSTIPIIFNSRGQAVDTSGIISNSTITLTETVAGQATNFGWGTLLGTGVFSYS